jgi:peptidyl-Lys metalloendopeptidase
VNASRYTTATNHFNAIDAAFVNQPITIDCGCKKTYYAYVYPTQPYKIYVCKAFWTAPNTGTDSRAGTLIHEMSHFNVVAGTDDHAYGQSAAKSLAISNPTNALDNADNHEYFSENTPAQN